MATLSAAIGCHHPVDLENPLADEPQDVNTHIRARLDELPLCPPEEGDDLYLQQAQVSIPYPMDESTNLEAYPEVEYFVYNNADTGEECTTKTTFTRPVMSTYLLPNEIITTWEYDAVYSGLGDSTRGTHLEVLIESVLPIKTRVKVTAFDNDGDGDADKLMVTGDHTLKLPSLELIPPDGYSTHQAVLEWLLENMEPEELEPSTPIWPDSAPLEPDLDDRNRRTEV